MSEVFGDEEKRRAALKELIERLHAGEDPEKVKEDFKELIKGATPMEISAMESKLIADGMPREEIHKLCDVHLAAFRETLEKQRIIAPEGHPVRTLMDEHAAMLQMADELRQITGKMQSSTDIDAATSELERIEEIAKYFKDAESHYLREENVLFPYLEKHGITEPPAIMWMDHDKIRAIKNNIFINLDLPLSIEFTKFASKLYELSLQLAEMLSAHFFKENKILFPTALNAIPDSEWLEIRQQFDEMGYGPFAPISKILKRCEQAMSLNETIGGAPIKFESGSFAVEELEALLNTLPVDITFVDANDEVRYFSQGKDRIFVRTKAVIGRKVQQCHPQKSVHIVQKILDDFRSGARNVAEFWLHLGEKYVYIRYFAMRDAGGKYLGTLEVSQDIAPIQKIAGDRKLLD